MPHLLRRPDISVLMPAHNAERYVLQSVQSVLAQTFEDFELLVVNDCSSDRTSEILSSIRDRRLRVLTNTSNLGIVGSLNRAMAEASGGYIARIDADDICQPTRFARQRAFLAEHPSTLILGTAMSVLKNGQIKFSRPLADPDPRVLQWMLHVGNPVGHPSMMFRAELVDALGGYLLEEMKYAEDFDLSHRTLGHGNISVLPDYLVVYRVHDQNVTQTRQSEMTASVARVLRGVYSALLGGDHAIEATLVAEHLIACTPLDDPSVLERLGSFLNQLVVAFSEIYELDAEQCRRVRLHTSNLWWRAIQASVSAGARIPTRYHRCYRWSEEARPSSFKRARCFTSGLLRKRLRFASATPPSRTTAHSRLLKVNGVAFDELSISGDDPPTLYVVVDTEAEFDWAKGFSRSLTSVSAMCQQFRAQVIFDGYGARPIYVVDYAVASQAEGYEPLREIFDRGGCAVGAHLHPWVNPPFEETVCDHNSFAGNLPSGLEERKLCALVAMIKASFGVRPLFFKAGRYGVGPRTMDILARLGFVVDFSILPLADLRASGGPDFRYVTATPYRVGDGRILSIPMSRDQFGLLAPLPQRLHSMLHSPIGTGLHLPGVFSRSGLANTVTLSPEGISADEQIQLIQSMATRGYRTFTLHYHSPSLGMQTPYVSSEAELKAFLGNLERVCRFFFETFGGVPGNPADLVPLSLRDEVQPRNAP